MPGRKTCDLYELLQVAKNASTAEIKKNFHILAKKVHPDKNREDPNAKENFQALRKAYEVLIDKKKREIYDKNGYFDENIESFMDAYEKFRGIKITENDILEYQKRFKNSDEEKEDLIEYFEHHEGDISRILGTIIGSSNDDMERFRVFFEEQIKSKKYPKKFVSNFKQSKILTTEELDEEVSDIKEEVISGDEDEETAEKEMKGFIVPDTKQRITNTVFDSSDDEDNDIELCKGDNVKARWKGGIKYYSGVIQKAYKTEKKFDIKYDDDGSIEKKVERRFIRKIEKNNKPVRVKKRKKRSKEKVDVESMDDLRAAILGKNKSRKKAFDDFARKYTT